MCLVEAAQCILWLSYNQHFDASALSNYTESRKVTFANKFKTDVPQWNYKSGKLTNIHMACRMMSMRVKQHMANNSCTLDDLFDYLLMI